MSIIKNISTKLTRSLTYLRRDIAGMMGMYKNVYTHSRGVRIIAYHGICEDDPLRFNTLFISKKTFEKQLQFYKKYFHIVSLADLYDHKFNDDRFTVCLTFDDGFANNYTHVLPLLEKYQVPATFFITAIRKEGYDILWNDFLTIASTEGPGKIMIENEVYKKSKGRTYLSVNTKKPLADILRNQNFTGKKIMMETLAPYTSFKQKPALADYWLQMTIAEIKALASSPLVTIGSHGYYHNDLARITKEEVSKELNDSKYFLETIAGKPVTSLAFPYGSYSPEVIEEATKVGYGQLLATHFLYNSDQHNPAMKERIGVNPFISIHNQMLAIIKGNYA